MPWGSIFPKRWVWKCWQKKRRIKLSALMIYQHHSHALSSFASLHIYFAEGISIFRLHWKSLQIAIKWHYVENTIHQQVLHLWEVSTEQKHLTHVCLGCSMAQQWHKKRNKINSQIVWWRWRLELSKSCGKKWTFLLLCDLCVFSHINYPISPNNKVPRVSLDVEWMWERERLGNFSRISFITCSALGVYFALVNWKSWKMRKFTPYDSVYSALLKE